MPRVRDAVLLLLLQLIALSEAATSATTGSPVNSKGGRRTPPNVLILLADDLGIGDTGCFGNTTIHTPAIDRLCREGVRLTHHVAGATLCTPSRAGLLTSRYPQRFGLVGAKGTPPVIIHVASKPALPLSEPTIGRAFSAAGYSTHFTGKWHLGTRCNVFGTKCTGPLSYGFDSSEAWLPFSLHPACAGEYSFWVYANDPHFISASIAVTVVTMVMVAALLRQRLRWSALLLAVVLLTSLLATWFILAHFRFHTTSPLDVSGWMDHNLNCVVMNGTGVLEQPINLPALDSLLTQSTLRFIRSAAISGQPFLAFHSFTHPHTPVVVAPENMGRSKHGRYGDSVEEMDRSVGTLLRTLDELHLTNNTLVYFVSDHGGHLEAIGEDGQRTGGYNGRFKGGKAMGGMEGGLRVPGVLRYPGVLTAGGALDVPTSLLDALPTLLQLAGQPTAEQLLPDSQQAKELDGVSYAPLLTGGSSTAHSPMEGRVMLHHSGMDVHSVRYITGRHVYKLHLLQPVFDSCTPYQCGWGEETFCPGWQGIPAVRDMGPHYPLYDLTEDPYEDHPLPEDRAEYQKVVQHLREHLALWHARVSYSPSQLAAPLLPWLQPYNADLFLKVFRTV